MFIPNINADKKIAISLNRLGINTNLLTTIGEIEDTIRDLEDTPDHHWCNGLGKEYLYQKLLRKLRVKDLYFTKNPIKVKPSNPKWKDFCNDCMLLYVLDTLRGDKIFRLIHPTQYRNMLNEGIYLDGTTGRLPDYIKSIPTVIH